MTEPLIELRSATKRFPGTGGGIHTAVRNLNLAVRPGEFVAVVGPTGCGKSTTLSLVSGLEPASAGRTLVRGKDVAGIPAGVGYMFQQDAVLPVERACSTMSPTDRGCAAIRKPRRARKAGELGAQGRPCRIREATTRTNSPAACASGSRWRRRWSPTPRSC